MKRKKEIFEDFKENNEEIYVKRIGFEWNRKVVLFILLVSAATVFVSTELSYFFSHSFFTLSCWLVMCVTTGVLINYFVLMSYNVFRKINIEISTRKKEEQDEEFQTVMKIE